MSERNRHPRHHQTSSLSLTEKFVPHGPPCVNACPAGIDIPGYLRFIAQGDPVEAYKLILEKVPFPAVLGRICTHPCENHCRRREVNESISICGLKRYAADRASALPSISLKAEKDTGHRVAVIGAGPAGLTAAFYLRKKGHHVTLFEGRSKPGGMMRYGIPSYRLPEEILDKEIDRILGLGIVLKTDKKLGKDFDLDQLKKNHFEAIFIAIGLQLSRKMELEGLEQNNILWGVDFLREINEGREIPLSGKVVVVGGGNGALDAARVAKRLGAEEVLVLYRRSRAEMPAIESEVIEAEREGVEFQFLVGPVRVLKSGGRLTGICCRWMELGEADASGRPAPIPIEGSDFEISADHLIMAIGQSLERDGLTDKIQFSSFGTLSVHPDTLKTNIEGIFAGGDIARGPGSVIEAIEAGRRGASSIDQYLGGDGLIEETLAERAVSSYYSGKREDGFADLKRAETPTLPLSERQSGFLEVEQCFADEDAVREACRCLQCDLELRLARRTI